MITDKTIDDLIEDLGGYIALREYIIANIGWLGRRGSEAGNLLE